MRKILDVRTPEEHYFVGHPPMAWKIPLLAVSYRWDPAKHKFPERLLADFVERAETVLRREDTILAMCRSGGRSAMAVNQLAADGFTNAYNIVDGIEGDLVKDPQSVFNGKRMVNGWKNSAPWVYDIDPEKVILEEGAAKGFTPAQ